MSQVMLFAQQKGGAGKTTLLTQLAAYFAGAGRGVTLIDIDPQRSTTGWFDARVRRLGDGGGLDLVETSEWRAGMDIRKAAKAGDLVMVDAPGNADVLGRVAMREADFAVIPCQPSMPDVWASAATLKMAVKEGLSHAVVLNGVPPRGKVVETAIAALQETGAPILPARLGQRAAFAEAFAQGAGVTELPRVGKAAEEILALAAGLAQILLRSGDRR